eukprot:589407-Prymnesium_polylepis.1
MPAPRTPRSPGIRPGPSPAPPRTGPGAPRRRWTTSWYPSALPAAAGPPPPASIAFGGGFPPSPP